MSLLCNTGDNKGNQNANYVLAKAVCTRPKSSIHFTLFMSTLLAYIKMLLEKYGPYGSVKKTSITRANSCPHLLNTDDKLLTKLSNGTSSSGYSTMSVNESSTIQCNTLKRNDDNQSWKTVSFAEDFFVLVSIFCCLSRYILTTRMLMISMRHHNTYNYRCIGAVTFTLYLLYLPFWILSK